MKKIQKRHQPKGFDILYEDQDMIIGNKVPGHLSVRALWNKENTVHAALNQYVRKGNSKSHKRVYVVHRLDQDTSGVMVFAKSFEVQNFLKDDWKNTKKIYYAIVLGKLEHKAGTISGYLLEDEDYKVHTTDDTQRGKLAHTKYIVLKEVNKFSLVKIDLLTGKKNQIRVHFADVGHPVVGDVKYGGPKAKHERLALHARSITLTHPFNRKRLTIEAPLPEFFSKIVGKIEMIEKESRERF
ncbi:MAG: RluA family pseudouridine synthase [Candidatus Omnitrophica bacterium]|nr:RluA family pseudouridine synthase [Candidatus Omnitrophota bacterium]